MNKQNNNKNFDSTTTKTDPQFNEYKLQMAFVYQGRKAIRQYEGRNSVVSRKTGIKMDKLE